MYSPWRESFLYRHKYVKVKTRKSKETQNKRQTNETYLEECRMNEKRLEPYDAERYVQLLSFLDSMLGENSICYKAFSSVFFIYFMPDSFSHNFRIDCP